MNGIKHVFHVGGTTRIVDSYDAAAGIIAEVKSGYITLSERIMQEITNDLLIQEALDVKIQWHFFSSAGQAAVGGPSAPLLEYLISHGIDVIFH